VTVRKVPKRESGGPAALIAAALLLLTVRGGAAGGDEGNPVGGPQQSAGRVVVEPGPAARTVAPLLARLWASGFFRRNEAVRLELENNSYLFFDEGSPAAPKGSKGWGCYTRSPSGEDIVYLRKDLFSHFELGLDGLVEHPRLGQKVLPVLVHEICHDLWMNVLDQRERAAFCREGDELMQEYLMALTAEEQRRFLLLAGDDAADPGGLKSYAGIEGFLSTKPPRAVCGQELFAWLAERLFSTKAKIPIPLRKYYSCIITGIAPVGEEARR
jgi:hypothetical protein